MSDFIEDFEEQFRVKRTGRTTWEGVHPLRLPVKLARGVYGGNTISQTLLVAIESTKNGDEVFVPEAFHLYFVKAGSAKVVMKYDVEFVYDDPVLAQRSIKLIQKDRVVATALCTLRKKGVGSKKPKVDIQCPVPDLKRKYPDPNKLRRTFHTDYVRNAYSDEFMDYKLTPEENKIDPAERWITVWSGTTNVIDDKYASQKESLLEPVTETPIFVEEEKDEENDGILSALNWGPAKVVPSKYQKSFSDPMFNFIGVGHLSDSALLTTLARVLHIPWNPTEDHPFLEYDRSKDARKIMAFTLNAIQIFHYLAMSLDHHIYFHIDNLEGDNAFDIVKEWLCFTYQVKRLSNNRALVRGHLFNNHEKCIATVIQEGLVYMVEGVPENIKL
jgi:acyl-CoA thioesterase II